MDDVRIYNRALSAADILQLYNYTDHTSWRLSSTDFSMHSVIAPVSGGNSISSFSTSADFKAYGVGGETAIGTSTSADFGLWSGYMRNAYKSPAPIYEQTHYHWRKDDGSESAASSDTGGVQDTATTSVTKGVTERLRVEIANHGGTILNFNGQKFGLQYAIRSTTCSALAPSAWANVGPVGTTNTDWVMANSTYLTNGADTTNIAVVTGGVSDSNHTFLTPNGGVVENTSTTTAAISVPSDSFIELEYAIQATTIATGTANYCFRVDNASSTSNFLYTTYPQATLAADISLTFITDSTSESFQALSPGNIVATSSLLFVKTNNGSGFNVVASRNNAADTLLLNTDSSIMIPDKIAWVPGGNCATAGNSTASTTNPNTLEFRVRQAGTDSGNYCSAWWGADDTTANALFGGFPTTPQQIVNRTSASTPTTTTVVLYNLNVPTFQKTGTYSGSVTYTVTTNP